VGCCVYTIPAGTKPQGVIPIGRPIDNTQLYVLDEYLQPVPIGVAGELYIGGAGVARGYLHQPELTAQRFIPNPFDANPNARLYKTGDRARWLSDGNLDFLGRLDFQVKVRGYRIELGEIESVLERHPEVRKAVVVDRTDSSGENRLIAYVVVDRKDDLIPELRKYLQQKLPDYMLPSAFIVLDELPLTSNGKVDRKALPEPDVSRNSESVFSSDQTPLERKLATVWSDVLGVTNIGVDDNFFDLGGHSLLAVRLFARLREMLGLDLPLRMLFEAPTIVDLAQRIENIIWAAKKSSPNIAGGDDDPHEEITI
jgi:acyl carrier protein